VTEGKLRSLAELQQAVLQCMVSSPAALPASGFPAVLPSRHVMAFELPAVLRCRLEAREAAAASCTWWAARRNSSSSSWICSGGFWIQEPTQLRRWGTSHPPRCGPRHLCAQPASFSPRSEAW